MISPNSKEVASSFSKVESILLQQVGKRFNRDWIFRKLDYSFEAGKAYAITGPNGSGKSTLLQVIAGSTNASEGLVKFQGTNAQSTISSEEIYQHVAIAAPYLELIEEMTAQEFLQFHASFKNLTHSIDEIISVIGLDKAANKQIRYYSSGMKQRVKLAQAIFVDAAVVLLDEPCTNLDKTGYDLYHHLIETYCQQKLIIVSSNDENEMDFCGERLSILDWK